MGLELGSIPDLEDVEEDSIPDLEDVEEELGSAASARGYATPHAGL